jgi:hypothetical protein
LASALALISAFCSLLSSQRQYPFLTQNLSMAMVVSAHCSNCRSRSAMRLSYSTIASSYFP